jgi:hypothetical protein
MLDITEAGCRGQADIMADGDFRLVDTACSRCIERATDYSLEFGRSERSDCCGLPHGMIP